MTRPIFKPRHRVGDHVDNREGKRQAAERRADHKKLADMQEDAIAKYVAEKKVPKPRGGIWEGRGPGNVQTHHHPRHLKPMAYSFADLRK